MKVTVLDDYQHAFVGSPAIARLRQRAQVQIFTEKFASDEKLIQALKGSQAIIPTRERTKFPAALLKALADLELISQTGNHAYHVDVAAATEAGILITMAPGGLGVTELTIGLMIAVMRRMTAIMRPIVSSVTPRPPGVKLTIIPAAVAASMSIW